MNKELETLINNLINEIATVGRLYQFTDVLEEIEKYIYSTKENENNIINKYFPISSETSSTIKELNNQLKNKTIKEIASTIGLIKEELAKVQSTRVTIAFEPNIKFLKNLNKEVNQYLNKTSLIDVNVDSNLVGGLLIIDEGNLIDLSLSKKLDTYFQENEPKVKSLYSTND